MNFDDSALVAEYGSWIRVQVAFYDFLFETGMDMCAKHFREASIEAMQGGFADGNELYENAVVQVEQAFDSPESAWTAFKEQNGK